MLAKVVWPRSAVALRAVSKERAIHRRMSVRAVPVAEIRFANIRTPFWLERRAQSLANRGPMENSGQWLAMPVFRRLCQNSYPCPSRVISRTGRAERCRSRLDDMSYFHFQTGAGSPVGSAAQAGAGA